MRVGLLAAAALLGVAIAVQVAYARAYAKSATRSVKVVWGANIGLLALLLVGLVYYALTVGVS